MSAIRMTHPEHGATHVYDLGEQKRLEGYGWSVETPTATSIILGTIQALAPADAALDAKLDGKKDIPVPPMPPKKRGRPARER